MKNIHLICVLFLVIGIAAAVFVIPVLSGDSVFAQVRPIPTLPRPGVPPVTVPTAPAERPVPSVPPVTPAPVTPPPAPVAETPPEVPVVPEIPAPGVPRIGGPITFSPAGGGGGTVVTVTGSGFNANSRVVMTPALGVDGILSPSTSFVSQTTLRFTVPPGSSCGQFSGFVLTAITPVAGVFTTRSGNASFTVRQPCDISAPGEVAVISQPPLSALLTTQVAVSPFADDGGLSGAILFEALLNLRRAGNKIVLSHRPASMPLVTPDGLRHNSYIAFDPVFKSLVGSAAGRELLDIPLTLPRPPERRVPGLVTGVLGTLTVGTFTIDRARCELDDIVISLFNPNEETFLQHPLPFDVPTIDIRTFRPQQVISPRVRPSPTPGLTPPTVIPGSVIPARNELGVKLHLPLVRGPITSQPISMFSEPITIGGRQMLKCFGHVVSLVFLGEAWSDQALPDLAFRNIDLDVAIVDPHVVLDPNTLRGKIDYTTVEVSSDVGLNPVRGLTGAALDLLAGITGTIKANIRDKFKESVLKQEAKDVVTSFIIGLVHLNDQRIPTDKIQLEEIFLNNDGTITVNYRARCEPLSVCDGL